MTKRVVDIRTLKSNAQTQATEGGHALGEWELADGVWSNRCVQGTCNASVTFSERIGLLVGLAKLKASCSFRKPQLSRVV